MKCTKCESQLAYGDKYCNTCGEKIPLSSYGDDYKKTLWGKIDKVNDWYDTLLLKKITDSIIFKILLLVLILSWGLFDAYTDYTNIKLLESESYTIEYNKKLDEYYIYTPEEEVRLNLYIPGYTDSIGVKEYIGDEITNEKEMSSEKGKSSTVVVKKEGFDYVVIESVKESKVTDSVKIYITE